MSAPVPSLTADSSVSASGRRWPSLWWTAFVSLIVQLWLCQFFFLGSRIPESIDIGPLNLWKSAYQFPPQGEFLVLNWLGRSELPPPLNPFTLAGHLPPVLFFVLYTPCIATLAFLMMAAFLRELELSRPAALFGGIVFAWQGDLLTFIFPGHFAYITTWPFYALAAWAALRAQRTQRWPYVLVAGACCGTVVGLAPDRGGIISLLIAALLIAPGLRNRTLFLRCLARTALCAGVALIIALAALFALFQSYIEGVKLAGASDRNEVFNVATQFNLPPTETLTYLVPGLFGWHSDTEDGPYWGWIGQRADHVARPGPDQGGTGGRTIADNFNLAISTIGTVASLLALIGAVLLLPGVNGLFGPSQLSTRQLFFARLIFALGAVTLILAWGFHTPIYRVLFALPLMDKWRNPLKWLEITNFALVTLSALGVQHVLKSLHGEAVSVALLRRRLCLFLAVAMSLFLVCLLLTFVVNGVFGVLLANEGYGGAAILSIQATVRLSLGFALAVTIGMGVVLYAVWHPDPLRDWKIENPWLHRLWQALFAETHLPATCAVGLACLVVVQLAWVAGKFVQPADTEMMMSSNPLVDRLRADGPVVRATVDVADPLLNSMLLNQFAAAKISCIDISAASRIPDDLSNFLTALENDRPRLFLLAGVKYIVLPRELTGQVINKPGISTNLAHEPEGYVLQQTESPDTPSHAVLELRDYFKKVTLISGAEEFSDEGAMLARLSDPAWKPRSTILLRGDVASTPPTTTMEAPDQVHLRKYTPHEIFIDAEANQGGYLLINDQYDPGWQATVNGVATPVLRADYLLRAIPVGPGASHVEMRYVPHYHVRGLNLPVLTTNLFCDGFQLLIWLVAGVALWWRRDASPVSSIF